MSFGFSKIHMFQSNFISKLNKEKKSNIHANEATKQELASNLSEMVQTL